MRSIHTFFDPHLEIIDALLVASVLLLIFLFILPNFEPQLVIALGIRLGMGEDVPHSCIQLLINRMGSRMNALHQASKVVF